jgi:asparagine synthase (glutamine-hydrolysing)
MCGIAGLAGDFVPGLVERMNAAQAHRGPDGSGIFERPEAQIALGHVRLAVLDLSDFAAQPMLSPDGRYVLIYNGEIYNFAELQREFAGGGPRPVSSGDTEVLLHGLMRRGSRFVERLNGMFAFALWDNHERELLLARDPLGIKPLYYAEPKPGSIVFASEIKAICAHPAVAREPDFKTIQQHLAFCHSCSDRTAIRGIKRLEPGTILRWKAATRQIQITRYWEPPFGESESGSVDANRERLRAAVETATARQLVSDVPVGSFLSGGLDSSLITAIAARGFPRSDPFRSFTVSIARNFNRLDQAHDDLPYARGLAELLGLSFQEIQIAPHVASLLPTLVRQMDEPLADPAIISCYLVSQLARQRGTKVLLSGQGADELFGGYPRYAAVRALRWADRLPTVMRRGIARGAALVPGALGGPGGAAMRRIGRVLRDIHRPADERFLAYCMSTPSDVVNSVFKADVRAELDGERPDNDCRLRMQARALKGEDRFLERDLSVYLPNHNLLYTDKMAMAVGVEARVPLLDLELVKLACSLPVSQKLTPRPKAILREAARGLVPNGIIDRPKAGFGAPYRHWLKHDLASLWNDMTDVSVIQRRGWFSADCLRRIREQSQSGRADYYMLQWAILTMELWAREFLDRNPAQSSSSPRNGPMSVRHPLIGSAA